MFTAVQSVIMLKGFWSKFLNLDYTYPSLPFKYNHRTYTQNMFSRLYINIINHNDNNTNDTGDKKFRAYIVNLKRLISISNLEILDFSQSMAITADIEWELN